MSLTIGFKDGRKTESFDLSDICIENLSVVPREYHTNNINKYLTEETRKQLKSPLLYEYFMLGKNLYVEIADIIPKIEFRMLGIERVDEEQEDTILDLRDLVSELD